MTREPSFEDLIAWGREARPVLEDWKRDLLQRAAALDAGGEGPAAATGGARAPSPHGSGGGDDRTDGERDEDPLPRQAGRGGLVQGPLPPDSAMALRRAVRGVRIAYEALAREAEAAATMRRASRGFDDHDPRGLR